MNFEDFRKLATGSILFNLRRIIAPRMVTILYLLGLAAILLWAVNHFFYSFRFGFGNGLWGLLEIAVFGLLAFVALRISCEAVIVFFRAHQSEAAQATHPDASASLIDDVRGAIEELADEEPEEDEDDDFAPSPTPAPGPATPPRPVHPAATVPVPGEPAPSTSASPATSAPPPPPATPETPPVKPVARSAATSKASTAKTAKPAKPAAAKKAAPKRKPPAPKPAIE